MPAIRSKLTVTLQKKRDLVSVRSGLQVGYPLLSTIIRFEPRTFRIEVSPQRYSNSRYQTIAHFFTDPDLGNNGLVSHSQGLNPRPSDFEVSLHPQDSLDRFLLKGIRPHRTFRRDHDDRSQLILTKNLGHTDSILFHDLVLVGFSSNTLLRDINSTDILR